MACTNYIEPAELSRIITAYKSAPKAGPGPRQRKRAIEELCPLVMQIAAGVHSRFRFVKSKDDFVQECVVQMLKRSVLKKADPAQNLFNFITKCCKRVGLGMRKAEAKEHGALSELADLIDRDSRPVRLVRRGVDVADADGEYECPFEPEYPEPSDAELDAD